MLAVVIGLVLVASIAVGIVLLVALPHLRHGSRILTPDGERKVKQVQSTAHGTIAAIGNIRSSKEPEQPAEPMRPVEEADLTEAGPVVPAGAVADAPPVAPGAPEPVVTAYPQPAIGRQRPSPIDSGPLPEVDEEPAIVAHDEPTRPVQVIDVRETADTDADTRAGQA